MSVRDDFRLEQLERREAGNGAMDLRKSLGRLASAVEGINRQISGANAHLPEGARQVSPIAWRPNPGNRHIVRARKWRVKELYRLITDIHLSLWSVESRLEYVIRQIDSGNGAGGVSERELEISIREIQVAIRDIEGKGLEIDSRPSMTDSLEAHFGEIMLVMGIVLTIEIVVTLVLLAETQGG